MKTKSFEMCVMGWAGRAVSSSQNWDGKGDVEVIAVREHPIHVGHPVVQLHFGAYRTNMVIIVSFPSDVKEQALVACGRCCCLCHIFCGIKIELHHVIQKAEGGLDTLDNCIPLCFNCHSDMRSYDHKHPKGTKYSPEELIRHRDLWYEKVKNSPEQQVGNSLNPI